MKGNYTDCVGKSNDPELEMYCRNYCKILTEVIILAKTLYDNNKFTNSTNKPKIKWSIANTITDNKQRKEF